LLAVEETLILCGLASFFEEYVPVFLAEKIYIEPEILRGGVNYFAGESNVCRNSILAAGCARIITPPIYTYSITSYIIED